MKEIIESALLYKKYLTEDLVIVGFNTDMIFNAGQFFHIILDKNNPDDEHTGFRPFSILNSPDDARSRKVIESFIKLIPGGLASEYIKNLKVGDKILLRGAYGKFQLDTNNKHVFLCAGTGITPVHSIIEQNLDSGNEFILIHSTKTKQELLYYEKFQEWMRKNRNFHYFATLTREECPEWDGLKGRITHHMGIIGDLSDKTVYICGVKDFVIDMLSLIRGKAKNIIIERYN